jgi:hypothetical protein
MTLHQLDGVESSEVGERMGGGMLSESELESATAIQMNQLEGSCLACRPALDFVLVLPRGSLPDELYASFARLVCVAFG